MGQPFPGKWSFKWHPWLKDMCDENGNWVGQKSAQAGYTEVALNRVFYMMDIHAVDTLYVLPAKTPDAGDFSAGRFDTALQLSPHLGAMFSDVKNIGHKKAGHVSLYIRGSRARSGLKSIPVAFIVFDEVDEMTQENIPLAEERSAGQLVKQNCKISTPRIENMGINKYFKATTMEEFFFQCPHCSKWTNLSFPESIVITAEEAIDPKITDTHLICKECKLMLDHASKCEWLAGGQWTAQHPERLTRGFHVNQLYSSTVAPATLAASYLRSLSDPTEEQEFFNSKLGLTHEVKGARVLDSDIDDCIGDFKTGDATSGYGIVTMGVDVGKFLHYWIDQWTLGRTISGDINSNARARTIAFGKLEHFEELDDLMHQYRVLHTVVDANPEKREAIKFAHRYWGHVRICYYGNNVKGRDVTLGTDEPSITVDRTSWLDQALGRFKRRHISLPQDLSQEARAHLKALVRIYEKDKNDNPVGRYVKGSEDDHYAHARNYSEISLQLAASMSVARDMRSPA